MSVPHCRSCHAVHGTLVVRKIQDPEQWSLDTDLFDEWPKDYLPPVWVKVSLGRCETCSRPVGLPPPEKHRCQGRSAVRLGSMNSSRCARYALVGSEYCRQHQNQTEAAS